MTEEQWLTSTEPGAMLAFLQRSRGASERKLRLYAAACCRRYGGLLVERHSVAALTCGEQLAEGVRPRAECGRAHRLAQRAADDLYERLVRSGRTHRQARPAVDVAEAVCFLVDGQAAGVSAYNVTETLRCAVGGPAALAALIRDGFGNPFRAMPAVPAAALAWNDGCVAKLAAGIYEECDFSSERMGVLADALEEAGCDSGEVIGHLRGRGPHVRGCWVVDLVLGKG